MKKAKSKFIVPTDYLPRLPQEQELFEKYGWFVHYVPVGDNTPFGCNAHTHGMPENHNHPDIQICVPVRPEIMMSVMWTIFNTYISKGVQLEPGKEYDQILKQYSMRAVEAIECDRVVIRMCCPDKNGEYVGEYAKQLTWLNNDENEPKRNI